MNETHDIAIRLESVSKHYGGTNAVRNLSLTIPAGQICGFLGPNGAGKTTTIKMLMGVVRRDGGHVSVLGVDPGVDSTKAKSLVGYVPEQHFIHGWMRVGEAISFCRTFYPSWNDALVDKLLSVFDLDKRKRFKHLSKGNQVKLSLLLALAHEPDVLILDEPMAGLDPLVREELLDGVLQSVCDRPRSILFSSHTFADVQRLADSVAIIDQGELLVHCGVEDLLAGTKRIRAVLANGAMPFEAEGAIWQRVQNREWLITIRDFSANLLEGLRSRHAIEHIEVIDLALEDIFKDYIRGRRSSTCI
jgi:ABC-2 type transport system ATP-binding protein